MTTLLVSHALTDGLPLAGALREIGEPGPARDAEAGELDACLRHLGFPEDLRLLARLWPAALRPARTRLSALPSPLLFQLSMAQTLGYLALIATLQASALVLLSQKILPHFEAMGAELGTTLPIRSLTMAPLLLVLLAVLLPAGLLTWTSRSRRSWRHHHDQARHAAMATGMVEADAPLEARRALSAHLSTPDHASADIAELELITTQSLALAEQAHHRSLAVVRTVGIGGLVLIATAVLTAVYRTLALISVPL